MRYPTPAIDKTCEGEGCVKVMRRQPSSTLYHVLPRSITPVQSGKPAGRMQGGGKDEGRTGVDADVSRTQRLGVEANCRAFETSAEVKHHYVNIFSKKSEDAGRTGEVGGGEYREMCREDQTGCGEERSPAWGRCMQMYICP